MSIFALCLNYAQFFLYLSILSQLVSELFSSCFTFLLHLFLVLLRHALIKPTYPHTLLLIRRDMSRKC
jgi:hypothetical protein